jgi:hypothetical protein
VAVGILPGLIGGEVPLRSGGFAIDVLLGDGAVELGDGKARRLRRRLRRLLRVQPQHHGCNNATAHHTGDDGGRNAPKPLAAVLLQLLVVGFPLFRVFQKLVGGNELPELQLGGRIASIEVGMERLGGLAECGPDCLFVGMTRHAQNIIKCVHGCPWRRHLPA